LESGGGAVRRIRESASCELEVGAGKKGESGKERELLPVMLLLGEFWGSHGEADGTEEEEERKKGGSKRNWFWGVGAVERGGERGARFERGRDQRNGLLREIRAWALGRA